MHNEVLVILFGTSLFITLQFFVKVCNVFINVKIGLATKQEFKISIPIAHNVLVVVSWTLFYWVLKG